jgi:hypothetical protein
MRALSSFPRRSVLVVLASVLPTFVSGHVSFAAVTTGGQALAGDTTMIGAQDSGASGHAHMDRLDSLTGATLVQDTFSRTVTRGWGSAEVGGAYTLQGGISNYIVVDGQGVMLMPAPQLGGAALLPSVSARDVDMRVEVQTSIRPFGGEEYAYLAARIVDSQTEYRAQLRIEPASTISLRLARVHANAETELGQVRVPNLRAAPGTPISLRLQVTGISPTTLRFKAWTTGQSEPSTWQLTKTDSTAELQTSGAVGLRCWLPRTATNAPVRFIFDNFIVTR